MKYLVGFVIIFVAAGWVIFIAKLLWELNGEGIKQWLKRQ